MSHTTLTTEKIISMELKEHENINIKNGLLDLNIIYITYEFKNSSIKYNKKLK